MYISNCIFYKFFWNVLCWSQTFFHVLKILFTKYLGHPLEKNFTREPKLALKSGQASDPC